MKFHSNLLAPRSNILIDSEGEESVASVPEDYYANYSDNTFEEEGLDSSENSDLFEKGKNKSSEEDVVSYTSLSHDSVRQPEETQRNGLVRGASKENLRVEVVGNSHVCIT